MKRVVLHVFVLFVVALCTLSCKGSSSAAGSADTPAVHEIDSTMIDPFYSIGRHSFRIADTQTIPAIESGDYSVSWYVDTEEWDFDPETNHIFAKIEFKKGNEVIATFIDDEGWSYIGVENSKALMFRSFKVDEDCTALVFLGGIYAAGIPKLTIFVMCNDEVELVFNKEEYFIGDISNDRITIKGEYQGPELGYISISDGHISIVNKDYPSGKIIY